MGKAIEALEREWRKIVYTHEKEAALAWRGVDLFPTDSEGEAQYLRNLISAAEYYIENK